MKKKVLMVLAGAMLVSGVVCAAPVVEVEKGEVHAGYTFTKADFTLDGVDLGKDNVHNFYAEYGLSDKFLIGIEYGSGNAAKLVGPSVRKWEEKETDAYIQYKFNSNFRLLAGARHYDTGVYTNGVKENIPTSTKLLYGLSARTDFSPKVSGYATFLKTSAETEWRVGTTYSFNKSTYLDLNYKYKDFDHNTDMKGIGLGIGFKF